MGIDHSNPYIHSTTVLCDIHIMYFAHVGTESTWICVGLHTCISVLSLGPAGNQYSAVANANNSMYVAIIGSEMM